ncbi:amidohydrolase family protein [Streptomyces pactum]|uniref:Amidohydrolase family protein n=1 Tax=Streptomyces pactum TaxID=68249 RepID=A0ABS0NFK8_9ACTN|nr:amidohydrolase family protein [Streptomyces pactum]MBH5333980.1 amidohydrolase family protein [Streptomyces pactum]
MSERNRAVSRRSLLAAGGTVASAVAMTGEPVALAATPASRHPGGGDAGRARIDVHHHYTAPAWVDWAERAGLVRRAELPPFARWDAASTLALMDRAGIATAVLNPTSPGRYRSAAQAKEGLSVMYRALDELVRAHPGRFAFVAPLFPEDLALSRWSLRRGFDELGAVGVSLKANAGGVYLGDRSYDRLFAELDERAAVVLTHPLDLPGGRPDVPTVPGVPNFMCDFLLDTTRAAVNMIVHRTLDRFPRVSVVLPHAGGFLPHIATRLESQGRMCTPPVEPARVRDHLHRFCYDTAGPMSPAGTLVATVGAGRLLFGSDWPATPPGVVTGVAVPGLDADPALTHRQRRGVNRDNALRIMPRLARYVRPRGDRRR